MKTNIRYGDLRAGDLIESRSDATPRPRFLVVDVEERQDDRGEDMVHITWFSPITGRVVGPRGSGVAAKASVHSWTLVARRGEAES